MVRRSAKDGQEFLRLLESDLARRGGWPGMENQRALAGRFACDCPGEQMGSFAGVKP